MKFEDNGFRADGGGQRLHRRGAETPREDGITGEIIGAAIEVHRELGPGLLESAYEQCLCHELSLRGIPFQRQVDLPVVYKGVHLDCGYRMDLVVADVVVVELKTVDKLLPIHDAQWLTYLKLYHRQIGLLLNFNVPTLKDGIKRMVNNYHPSSASRRLAFPATEIHFARRPTLPCFDALSRA